MVHVESTGCGPDLVLLHGWGLNGGVWHGLLAPLSERYRLHIVDLPGFGHSQAALPEPFDLPQLVEAVLPQVPEHAAWLGWSLGGMAAMQAAVSYPERVTQLLTVASSPCFVAREQWPGMAEQTLADFSQALLADHQKTLSRFIALQAMGSDTAREETKDLRQVLSARPTPSDAALEGGLAILANADLRNDIGQITQPWLRLYGRRDSLVPRHHQRVMDQLHPGSQSHCFTGAAHAPFLCHKSEFIDQVTGFLSPQTAE